MSLLYKTAVFFAVVSTLTLGIQSTFGWAWFLSSVDERSDTYACRAFASFISSSLVLSLSTLLILINLYWHSVETIFNRKAPSFPSMDFFSSFWTHSCLIRPVEVMFRYLTARMRILPDIIVLGEVRCGTTTLCEHVRGIYGCHEPFCMWKHPELDKKETFFFVGHYLGNVNPRLYRMNFPLAFTKAFHERILGKPFFSFDGCAQYLTSPSAAYLIAETYRDANEPPPVLIACVREPYDQVLSWWRYENMAMKWGTMMGLPYNEWNSSVRTASYPPKTISEALQYSNSATVTNLYQKAEDLVKSTNQMSLTESQLAKCLHFVVPVWAITWPGGQLSVIGKKGGFHRNIMRFKQVFQTHLWDLVGPCGDIDELLIVSLAGLSTGVGVDAVLRRVMSRVQTFRPTLRRTEFQRHWQNFVCKENVRRNPRVTDQSIEPSSDELQHLRDKLADEDTDEYIEREKFRDLLHDSGSGKEEVHLQILPLTRTLYSRVSDAASDGPSLK